MIHSKSKSTKIKEKEEDQNINTVVNIKTNRFNNNNSLTLNSIDLTKENLNLKLITSEKISNLLYDSENDDKVVNISKLDEELYTDEKRIKKYDKNVTVGSDFELVIGNINENDTSKPIINISSLDTPIHLQNEIQTINLVNNNNVSTSNTSINNNIINNDNNNKNNSSSNKIVKTNKIKKDNNLKDEAFKTKSKKCFRKIPLYLKIIFLIIIIIIFSFLFFFLFKILNNRHKN